jgi:hypothetical protein
MSDEPTILKLYRPLSEEEFCTLECTIASTPAPTEVKLLGKLTRTSGINNNQLKDFLKTAQIAYDNQEWTKCAQVLGMLIANRIGPVSSKGRFAVAAILAGAIDEAYTCAKECIEAEPRESSSYLAIAIICTRLGLLTQALRWLKLAEMASSTTSSLHRELKSRIERDWADCTSLPRNHPIFPSLSTFGPLCPWFVVLTPPCYVHDPRDSQSSDAPCFA